eukprot:CAMPEP_0119298254 /NCGR_PEP_ID=MMETSP1333-20130426/462_1 /TAXON_ID=418940 /ORGANISM="Scyphosphaera apsteinii, Strain RCC1455" /LENGTH=345 /DNA_ID=CAMNT_0007299311 /DNA_START=184 /DNA_END=1221 /DNA_ORIENTATION=+
MSAREDIAAADMKKTGNQVILNMKTAFHQRHVGPLLLKGRVRPVKVDLLLSKQLNSSNASARAIYVPIWKSASTSTHSLLGRYGNGVVIGPHAVRTQCHWPTLSKVWPSLFKVRSDDGFNITFPKGPVSSSLGVSSKIKQGATIVFTVVRDPLSRFVSSLRPHNPLPLCNKAPCNSTLADLSKLADLLLANPLQEITRFEGEHRISQTFFLSATDASGCRLHYTHIARVETLADDLVSIFSSLGAKNITSMEINAWRHKNEATVNGKGGSPYYVNALLAKHANVVCNVCVIYARDYTCLGYPWPAACNSTQCRARINHELAKGSAGAIYDSLKHDPISINASCTI